MYSSRDLQHLRLAQCAHQQHEVGAIFCPPCSELCVALCRARRVCVLQSCRKCRRVARRLRSRIQVEMCLCVCMS